MVLWPLQVGGQEPPCDCESTTQLRANIRKNKNKNKNKNKTPADCVLVILNTF